MQAVSQYFPKKDESMKLHRDLTFFPCGLKNISFYCTIVFVHLLQITMKKNHVFFSNQRHYMWRLVAKNQIARKKRRMPKQIAWGLFNGSSWACWLSFILFMIVCNFQICAYPSTYAFVLVTFYFENIVYSNNCTSVHDDIPPWLPCLQYFLVK